jgi:hypothetical protein
MESYQSIGIVLGIVGIFLGLLSSLAIGYAQMPSPETGDAVANKAFHIADMMQTVTSIADRCESDISTGDFSTFQACANFIDSIEKHIDQALKESATDITSIRGY